MQPLFPMDLNVHPSHQAAPKLVRAAHEFEGQLMKELLKPLNEEGGFTGDDESSSAGALGDFASEALGQALSRHGGLGLASKIIGQLSHSESGAGSAKEAGDWHEKAGMRLPG